MAGRWSCLKAYAWKNGIPENSGLHVIKFAVPAAEIKSSDTTSKAASEKIQDFAATDVCLDWITIPTDVVILIKTGVWKEEKINESDYLPLAADTLARAGCDRDDILTILSDTAYTLGRCCYRHRGDTKSRKAAVGWLWDYTVKKVWEEREAQLAIFKAQDEDAGNKDTSWQHKIARGENGGVKLLLKNTDLILSNQLADNVFVKDLFSGRDSYGADTPWGRKKGNYLSDIDLIQIRRWMSDTKFAIEPKKEMTLDAVQLIAARNGFHPVREYLNSLVWDGKPRIDTWIKDYLQGEAREPYLSQVSRLFLIAMCKRVFQPGCQWDYVLVLEGKQGTYKSSTARALVGDQWFMDNLPDLRDKDSMLNLQGKWLIELGELASTKRMDYDSVKAYLSRRVDNVRSPYGHLAKDTPRQSVFIGTVNEGQYLKDPTGNRRFWPVKVGVCDVNAVRIKRDQLFAEAMATYRATPDMPLMLDEKADAQAKNVQDEKRIDDDETEMRERLSEFIENQSDKPESDERFDFTRFKQRQLYEGPGIPWGPWLGKGYATKIGAQVLTNLGFEKRKIRGFWFWGKREKAIL